MNLRTASLLLATGAAVGSATTSALVLWITRRKVSMLQDLDLHLHNPGVPENVLDTVRDAEIGAYRRMPIVRRLIEDGQDMAGMLWPQIVYRANYSVGAFRIKSQTAAGVAQYAIDRGLLEMRIERDEKYARLMPGLTQQPALNTWFAAVLLSQLRDQHPVLQSMSWDEIARNPDAIAKLYSGYTGAGGAWDVWEADVTPGPIARARLGYDAETGSYSGVREPSP